MQRLRTGFWLAASHAGAARRRGVCSRQTWIALAGGFGSGGALALAHHLQGPQSVSECAAAERRVDYVVLGGGTSAMGGIRGVRQMDKDGSILVVATTLSPALISGQSAGGAEAAVEQDGCAPFSLDAADLQRVTFDTTNPMELDVDRQTLLLSNGRRVCYTKGCLIASDANHTATGDHGLSAVASAQGARSIADSALERVQMISSRSAMHALVDSVGQTQQQDERQHIVILGGSADACVLSSTLAANGALVTQVCEEKTVMGTSLPLYVGNHVMWMLKRVGVEVLPYSQMQYCRVVSASSRAVGADGRAGGVHGAPVIGGSESPEQLEVFVRKSYDRLDVRKYLAHLLVVFPSKAGRSSEFVSENNGLEAAPDGGYVVNAELSARSGVYVAGPSAYVPHAIFGRVSLHGDDDAWASGLCAGRNMAGGHEQYAHVGQTMRCQMAGREPLDLVVLGKTDESLDTVAFWSMARWSAVSNDVDDEAPRGGEEDSLPSTALQQRRSSGELFDEFMTVAPRSGVVYFMQMPHSLTKGHQIAASGAYNKQSGRVVGAALLNMSPESIMTAHRLISSRFQVCLLIRMWECAHI